MDGTGAYSAFSGHRLVASGPLHATLRKAQDHANRYPGQPLHLWEDSTGSQIDVDLRGTFDELMARLGAHPHFVAAVMTPRPRTGPGRPRLGVVGREVSLLPRHWSWLESQPGGVSVTLRQLIEEARKRGEGPERARLARE